MLRGIDLSFTRATCVLVAITIASACSSKKEPATRSRLPGPVRARTVPETVTVRDAELERRVARLELRVLEKEAQVEYLQQRLEDTQSEVVRAMAKVQTVASRAEAASGMAEAEVSLQSLRSGTASPADLAQVRKLVQQSSTEFNKQNYGGALYLANQAKALVASYRGRLPAGARETVRSGETPFAVPFRLKIANRGNVREGPGTSFAVAFAVDGGAMVLALAHSEEWVRISDENGRTGWIFRSLVARP